MQIVLGDNIKVAAKKLLLLERKLNLIETLDDPFNVYILFKK